MGGNKDAAKKWLTRVKLAKALGCNPRTIAKWLEDGMPVARRGRGGRPSLYDPEACAAWRESKIEAVVGTPAGGLNWSHERARKERAQAVLAEQLAASRAQDLLPKADVERAWGTLVAAARTKLLTLPQTLADRITRVATLEGEAGVERVLEGVVDEVLAELSGQPPEDKPAPAQPGKRGKAEVA